MIDEKSLLDILEKQGDSLLSNPKAIYLPRGNIDVKSEQILTLLHNINEIESPKVITGLLMNLSSFITIGSTEQVWADLKNVFPLVTNYLDIYGIMETLRLLIVLDGEANNIFLNFLVDPSIPLDTVRPYALETLYDYLPPGYLTCDDERKLFLSELIINSLSTGDIYHRSFLIQLLFALHLTADQILSLSNLQEEFWPIIFDISLEKDNFAELLHPARRLKLAVFPFFEQENTIVSQTITDFESSIENSNGHISMMLNLFKIFYLFSTKDMKDFLGLTYNIFLNFTDEEWSDIKTISNCIYEGVNDSVFVESQAQEIYNFAGSLPGTSGKYFIFVHFVDVFKESCDFVDQLVQEICSDWMESETFNPVVFSFVISQVSEYLNPKEQIFQEAIYPAIFSFIETEGNPLLNYTALKALKYFHRDKLVNSNDFLNSLLELTLNANPETLKYYFQIISDVEKETRPQSDDDYDEEEEAIEIETEQETEVEKKARLSIKRIIREKLNEFIRSNLMVENLNPCLCGYLCDMLIYMLNENETNVFIDHLANVCKRLLVDPIPRAFPEILVQISYLILEILECCVDEETCNNYFTLFNPIYNFLLDIVLKTDFSPKESEQETEPIDYGYHKIIANVAILLSSISKSAADSPVPYMYPITIVSNILTSDIDDLIKFGISIFGKIIFNLFPPAEDQNGETLMKLFEKIVDIASTTDNLTVVNKCYSVFLKIIQNFEFEEFESIIKYIEHMKSIVFEERMKIFNCQWLTNLNANQHFYFFEFVSEMIEKGYPLTTNEILTLIRWTENIPRKIHVDLFDTISTLIESNQLIEHQYLLIPLWNAMNQKLKELDYNFAKNYRLILSILNCIVEFLKFAELNDIDMTNSNSNEEEDINENDHFDFSILYHCLHFFWKSDAAIHKKSVDVTKRLGPIYLRVYSLKKDIVLEELNYAILDQIGQSMLHFNNQYDWNLAQMVEDIISIYEKLKTLHLFAYTGADVLFTYYIIKSGSKEEEGLLRKIKDVLNDMNYHDSRIIDYLKKEHKDDEYYMKWLNSIFYIYE